MSSPLSPNLPAPKLPASARKYREVSAGLFVGVSEFADPSLPPVPYAVDDAVDLAHLFVVELELIDPKKTVLLLAGEPQKAESRQRLDELLAASASSGHPWVHSIYEHCYQLGQATAKSGLFVLSLATHGLLDQGEGVLAVAGSLKRRPVHTGLPLEVLLEDLSQARAERRLALVDACRDRFEGDTRGETGTAFGDAFVEAMEKAKGIAILAGASRGGFAYDDGVRQNGVFTAAVLDGLRGGAEGDAHAVVTLESVAAFAQRQVRDWVLKNRPSHKELSLGITPTYDPESMRQLPLAINGKAQVAEFEKRSREAQAHLLRLVGARDSLFREIQVLLEVEFPQQEHFELLEELEAFDGTPRWRRALRAFLDEKKEVWAVILRSEPVMLRAEPTIEDPFWAAATGRDEFGPWADLRVDSVVQRLRFIPPGEFWMGSPETEEGHTYWEGLRHRVKLTQGFWLASTPCTQEFWQLVMGNNPSQFQSSRRPVETVSWKDVQEFLKKLEDRVPRIGADLPTEAQWEYACRAGTETSTYAGELKILGACNAPLLDGIAWYSGNSGVGYELSEGADSSSWVEKQYQHVKAGPREVGQKLRNSWGLYDMLGNVWEWCRDAGEAGDPYPSAAEVVDPVSDGGSYRVHRGGSWILDVRNVRAAYRAWDEPGMRLGDLGFRFSLGRPRSGQAGRGAR